MYIFLVLGMRALWIKLQLLVNKFTDRIIKFEPVSSKGTSWHLGSLVRVLDGHSRVAKGPMFRQAEN